MAAAFGADGGVEDEVATVLEVVDTSVRTGCGVGLMPVAGTAAPGLFGTAAKEVAAGCVSVIDAVGAAGVGVGPVAGDEGAALDSAL